jgi:hypothetical protein
LKNGGYSGELHLGWRFCTIHDVWTSCVGLSYTKTPKKENDHEETHYCGGDCGNRLRVRHREQE